MSWRRSTETLIREAAAADLPFLSTMLHAASAWRDQRRPAPANDEILRRYLDDWGREGDLGLIAEDAGDRLGAAWWRLFPAAAPGYGFVAEDVPEISLAVISTRRCEGTGRRLLLALLARALAEGIPALSLSVEEDNPALRLYRTVGFEPVSRSGDSLTMRCGLRP